jgi:hypothetical protein
MVVHVADCPDQSLGGLVQQPVQPPAVLARRLGASYNHPRTRQHISATEEGRRGSNRAHAIRMASLDRSELRARSRRTASPVRALLLGLLFLAALALRLHGIKDLPLEFHPVRQYRSATIARSLYYRHADSVPEWKKRLASLSRQRADTLEPPLLEYMASFAYRAVGKERVWIPRALSSLFWLIGGAFLYLAVSRLVSPPAALFSAAFYLLAPFGIMASRSFQPDPLMVMLLLASVCSILLYSDEPSGRRLAVAATVSAFAILVKPVCLFVIIAAFVSLTGQGLRSAARNRRIWLFLVCALLPSVVYYAGGFLTAGYLRFVEEGSFRPRLFLVPSFWLGWLRMIEAAVGLLPFLTGILGILLFRKGRARSLAGGLWVGYLLFALAFNYAGSTHNYYQLQLIPIVAFSLAALAARFLEIAHRLRHPAAGATVLLLLSTLVAVLWIRRNGEAIYYEDRDQVTIAERIGEQTTHSDKAIVLSYAGGALLQYHGELMGVPWPLRSDMHAVRGWARPNLTIEQRFQELNQAYPSDYFIVTEMGEYRAQPQLAEFLVKRFPVLVRDDRYLVFDLRAR